MNCSNDSWGEDLVGLGRCEGRRKRDKSSQGFDRRVELLLTKRFLHLIWIEKIHQIEAGATSIIQRRSYMESDGFLPYQLICLLNLSRTYLQHLCQR